MTGRSEIGSRAKDPLSSVFSAIDLRYHFLFLVISDGNSSHSSLAKIWVHVDPLTGSDHARQVPGERSFLNQTFFKTESLQSAPRIL